MTPELIDAGYIQTKRKLANLLERRSLIAARTDLGETHRAEVFRSYDRMVKQYRREIKLYETTHETAAEAAEK